MTHGEEGLRYTEREVEVVAGHRVVGREVAVAFRWCDGLSFFDLVMFGRPPRAVLRFTDSCRPAP